MTRDKQLQSIDLDQVLEKRRLDQALNVKEFAVLAGISYSAARAWFRLPGFPAVRNVVFWDDFVLWRRNEISNQHEQRLGDSPSRPISCAGVLQASDLPARAARILAEAG